jgi:8-oxo-dGTP pyrophosphatase MutT (NUDIX family)
MTSEEPRESSERFLIRAAVYLLLLKKNSLLLARRFNTGWMDGKYSLIAGHIDGKEPVSKAMIREAKEEAGITIAKNNLLPATVIHRYYPDQEYIDFFFVAKKWSGTPRIKEPNKCDDMAWFPLNKLPDNLLPYIKEAILNFQNKIPFFESGWK